MINLIYLSLILFVGKFHLHAHNWKHLFTINHIYLHISFCIRVQEREPVFFLLVFVQIIFFQRHFANYLVHKQKQNKLKIIKSWHHHPSFFFQPPTKIWNTHTQTHSSVSCNLSISYNVVSMLCLLTIIQFPLRLGHIPYVSLYNVYHIIPVSVCIVYYTIPWVRVCNVHHTILCVSVCNVYYTILCVIICI